jgi:aryl-alcohol dehydrogenase-like predicted oxidoreductase
MVGDLDDSDWRKTHSPHFQEPSLSATLNLVEGLRTIAEDKNMTVAQVAIAWVLRRPEVTSAIAGSRRPSHIEDTVQAGEWDLGSEELAQIDALLAERARQAGDVAGYL